MDDKQGEDVKASIAAIGDNATFVTGIWVSYILSIFYMAVAAGAVSHLDLLTENAVKLPFLGIDLSLIYFFILTPFIAFLIHSYTLINVVLLSKNISNFHTILYSIYPLDGSDTNDHDANRLQRSKIRRQLKSNLFVQFLAGPAEIRQSNLGRALHFIAWVTLVFAPLMLFVEFIVQFLPYHSIVGTWTQRGFLIADIGIIMWLWPLVIHTYPDKEEPSRVSRNISRISYAFIVIFAVFIASFPGENVHVSPFAMLRKPLFEGDLDPNTYKRWSLWSNTLLVSRFNILDGFKDDSKPKAEHKSTLLSLRGRDLAGAIFAESELFKVDATDAHLEGANFVQARLRDCTFNFATLTAARFTNANVQGSYFFRARLTGSVMDGANLQGSNFSYAHLSGSKLSDTQWQGGDLRGADFRGADLHGANFQGLILEKADLQGANLRGAKMGPALINNALLWRADLDDVELRDLHGSPVWEAKYKSRPWSEAAYSTLLNEIQLIEDQTQKKQAEELVSKLKCLAPCSSTPQNNSDTQVKFAKVAVNETIFTNSLMNSYLDTLCIRGEEGLDIMRALLRSQINEIKADAKIFAARLLGKECNISLLLSDSDRVKLLSIASLASK